jgi:hypothetical protein
MAATKNAHDWHCEDHDTYGWRGEECRKCPTAPSEADALRNELNRLVDLCRQLYEAERPPIKWSFFHPPTRRCKSSMTRIFFACCT